MYVTFLSSDSALYIVKLLFFASKPVWAGLDLIYLYTHASCNKEYNTIQIQIIHNYCLFRYQNEINYILFL